MSVSFDLGYCLTSVTCRVENDVVKRMKRLFLKKHASLLKEIGVLLIILVVGLVFLFSKAFSNPYYYFAADVSEQYFPWWVYVNEKFHQLTLPIRNEYYLMGSFPFAARGETNVFYPISWFFHLFVRAQQDLNTAFIVFFIQQLSHYVLAGVFFYLFVRKGLELSLWPSSLASMVYVFSGSFMAPLVHPPYQYTLTWFPLLYFFYLQFLKERKIISILLAAGALALFILSGHPQIVYYFLAFFCFNAALLIVREKSPKKLGLLCLSVAMGLLGFMLAAVQILPTLELLPLTARVSPETTLKNLYNSLHPLYYLTLLVPKLYGRHRQGYWGSEYPWGNWDNFLYVGVLSVIFLFFSIWWKKRWLLFTFASSMILAVILSFGRYWEISRLLNQHMPFSESLSWVNRITMVFHFYAVVLIAIGSHVFIAQGRKRTHVLTLVFAVALGMVLLLLNVRPDILYGLQPAGRPPLDHQAFLNAVASVKRSTLLYFTSLFLVGIYWYRRWRFLLLALFALLLVDIIPVGRDFNPIEPAYTTPQELFGTTQQIEQMRKNGALFRVDGIGPRNIGLTQKIQTVGGYSTIVTAAYQQIIPYINLRYPHLLSLTNVKYVAGEEKDIPLNQFSPVAPLLWKNEHVLPRAFFVDGYKYVTSKQEMVQQLTDPHFDPQQYVLLYDNTQLPSDLAIQSSTLDIISRRSSPIVYIQSSHGDRMDVFVQSEQDGFLFLSQLNYPGWHATVDGKEHPLINANLSFYALPIRKGRHTVQFTFSPKSVLFGAALSSLTAAMTLFLIAYPRTRTMLTKKL